MIAKMPDLSFSPDSSENPCWQWFGQQDCNGLLRQFGFQPRVRETMCAKKPHCFASKIDKCVSFVCGKVIY